MSSKGKHVIVPEGSYGLYMANNNPSKQDITNFKIVEHSMESGITSYVMEN